MITTRQNISGSIYEQIPSTSELGVVVDRLLSFAKEKDKVIQEQAEEIGRLEERIANLEREKAAGGSSALDVDTARSAHAG